MSSGYRDEHEGLLARIAMLEEKLARAEAEGVEGLSARLAELKSATPSPDAAEVTSLRQRAEALQERLARLNAELEKLPGTATSPRVASPQRPRHRALYRLVAATLLAVAVLFLALTMKPQRNGGRTLCKGDLDALMLERLGARDCDPLLRVDATALPGGPNAVPPTALVDVTRRSYGVPGERLRGIDIPRVPPNGLVDLRTPAYLGVVSVHLAHSGGVFDFEGMHNGFEGDGELVPDPHCAVPDVFRAAAQAGTPIDAGETASLTYKALLPAGRAGWVFAARGTTLLIDDATCKVATELKVPR